MNVTGIGSTSLNSYLVNQLYAQNNTSSNTSSDPLSLAQTLAGNSSNQGESLHVELKLNDGSTLTIDYQSAGVQKKTSYEIGQYGNYTYGNDLFSPQNTANRILDFASSLWDGSSDKLDVLSKAIDQGISEARTALGNIPSWLNNIISQTEDLLHKGLDDMKSQIKAAA
jgi:hypothetical protein